jgi:hypothetical protein
MGIFAWPKATPEIDRVMKQTDNMVNGSFSFFPPFRLGGISPF